MPETKAHCAILPDRGVLAVSGPDAVAFLDNLATNALDDLDDGDVRFAALLSPQGKILFEFFAVRTADGFLLDTQRGRVADLAKRLALYKLRAKVVITDLTATSAVAAVWWTPLGAIATSFTYEAQVRAMFADPREPRMGLRLILETAPGRAPISNLSGAAVVDPSRYQAQRIGLGVPEGDADYPLGDTFPHEANQDQLAGVSFTKGCFVGQEVVARMQNKTVVRKRVVRLSGRSLRTGAEVKAGEAVVGSIGSVRANLALALVRLDRIAEAIDRHDLITVEGHAVGVDPVPIARYKQSLLDRPVIDL